MIPCNGIIVLSRLIAYDAICDGWPTIRNVFDLIGSHVEFGKFYCFPRNVYKPRWNALIWVSKNFQTGLKTNTTKIQIWCMFDCATKIVTYKNFTILFILKNPRHTEHLFFSRWQICCNTINIVEFSSANISWNNSRF